jgi:hypothetical protein
MSLNDHKKMQDICTDYRQRENSREVNLFLRFISPTTHIWGHGGTAPRTFRFG